MIYKVLVVDDSLFFRKRVSNIVNADSSLEVIDVAVDGKEAVEKAKRLKPDVITMDIEMPVMDGITAVRQIMQQAPTSILMFSSFTREGAKATFDALDAGALDFFPKIFDTQAASSEDMATLLRQKLRSLARKRLARITSSISNSIIRTETLPSDIKAVSAKQSFKSSNKDYRVLGIGTSTGGPSALQKILTALPVNFPIPIILIQHMPSAFTGAFAERLNALCKITVKEAEQGEKLQSGTAYLAPGGMQLITEKIAGSVKLKIYEAAENINYKPCVDITFNSLARVFQDKVLSIVLTGMGNDGENGARTLKQSGATIWAQDKNTSVVYGMPHAVTKAGIATESISLDKISERILVELKLRS